MKERKSFIGGLLQSKKLYFIIPIIGFLLAAPSLKSGWMLDDYYHRMVFVADSELQKELTLSGEELNPLDAFTFIDGVEEHNRKGKALGIIPWWSDDDLKVAFFRPIASLSHWIDYLLWPDSSVMMHIHNILFFCLLAAMIVFFYRNMGLPGWSAGLAALLLVVNSSWAMPVGWIANRNALLATLFALPALMAYRRYRQGDGLKWQLCGTLLFTLALLSGEAGLAIFAYIFSYTLFLDSSRWRSRLKAIAPYILIIIVWRLGYSLAGYGAKGSSFYIDPAGNPLNFLGVMTKRFFMLLGGSLGGLPVDLLFFFSSGLNTIMAIIGGLLFTLLALLLRPIWQKNRVAIFWAVGMLCAIVPFCSSFPANRNLTFPLLGGMGLFASLLYSYRREGKRESYKGLLKAGVVTFFTLFLIFNIALSPLSFLAAPGNVKMLEEMNNKAFEIEGVDDFTGKELIFVNLPMSTMLSYGYQRRMEGYSIPSAIRVLSLGQEQIEGVRVDGNSISIRPEVGFYPPPRPLKESDKAVSMAYSSRRFELLNSRLDKKVAVGEQFKAGQTVVEVEEVTPDNRPDRVTYHFAKPLDSPDYIWVTWDYEKNRTVRFTLPPQGESFEVN